MLKEREFSILSSFLSMLTSTNLFYLFSHRFFRYSSRKYIFPQNRRSYPAILEGYRRFPNFRYSPLSPLLSSCCKQTSFSGSNSVSPFIDLLSLGEQLKRAKESLNIHSMMDLLSQQVCLTMDIYQLVLSRQNPAFVFVRFQYILHVLLLSLSFGTHPSSLSSLRIFSQDTVTRYAHQTGHHVVRRFGWDCHGLPIEFEIDKELGIKV